MLNTPIAKRPVKAVLMDFDGTISTLRCGWEEVMGPYMAEVLSAPERHASEALKNHIDAYIAQSTGIQTIFQMKWLAEEARSRGLPDVDPWAYKCEYNRRLMLGVERKLKALECGDAAPDEYLMAGAIAFLRALNARGVKIFVASGTDHPDVEREARALKVYELFDEVRGAPPLEENCSKQRVLAELSERRALKGDQVAVIGDGKVEIALGKEAGAFTIGLASDEIARRGVNPVKRERLLAAGADVILGDFLDLKLLMTLLQLN